MNIRTTILIASLAAAVYPSSAVAQLRFCNRTDSKVTVAIAYVEKDAPGTTTNQHRGITAKGWYAFEPGECSQVSGIHVGNHWAYYYAHGNGRVWEGSAMLCVPSSGFTKGASFVQSGEMCPVGERMRGFRRMEANTRGYTMNLNR